MERVFEAKEYYEPTEGGTPLGLLDNDEAPLRTLAKELTQLRLQQVSIESYWPYGQENWDGSELTKTWGLIQAHQTQPPEFTSYEDWWDRRFVPPAKLPPGYYETMAEDVGDLFYYVHAVRMDETPEHLRERLLRALQPKDLNVT